MKKMRAVILGSGPSLGVPRIGNDWGRCDSSNPKNRRGRQSLLVELSGQNGVGTTRALIDTPPDIRSQLLDNQVGHIDGVILTHEHADHLHGLFELSQFYEATSKLLPFHISGSSWRSVLERFPQFFANVSERDDNEFLEAVAITEGSTFSVSGSGGDIRFENFYQTHGEVKSLGLRINDFAYSVDFSSIDGLAMKMLRGVDTWILDCLQYEPHSSHTSVSQALELIEEIKPQRAILNGLSSKLDYSELSSILPPRIEVAYDGMVIEDI